MDWSRTGSYVQIILWVLLSLGMWSGGWLLCAHLFRLRSRERLLAGLGLGIWLYILIANLLAQVVPVTYAFWGANLAVLAAGLAIAWRSPRRPIFPLEDLRHWQVWAGFGALFGVFLQINRGLAIFDDFVNIPLVSTIAAGDVPPHFYLNPERILDYHYGLHLLAAGLARVGGFYPWSAWDVYKALSIALATVLSALWLRRYWRGELVMLLTVLFVLFAGGARWLLLLVPEALVAQMSRGVELIGSAQQTAETLPEALAGAWRIAGSGPAPFPFAFLSGVTAPLSMSMSSTGGMATLALALLLLLARRRWSAGPGLAFGLALAGLALVSEQMFVMIWGGIFLAAAATALQRRNRRAALGWAWTLAPGALLAPWMGGVLTMLFQQALAAVFFGGGTERMGVPGVALRWPPAVLSGHLGALELNTPGHLLLGLAEIGPLLFLAPFVTLAIPRYLRAGKLLAAGLAIMALVSLATPLFLRFTERERDMARLTGGALSLWALLGPPYLRLALRRGGQLTRLALGAAYVTAVFSGLALFPPQLIAGYQPQASYFIDEPDLWMSRRYWDRLAPGAWALDPAYPYRPAALFARTTGPAYQSVYIEAPEFLALLADPNAANITQAGYRYVYLDRKTWNAWTPEQRRSYQQACVKLVEERKTPEGDFRRLYDLRDCR